MTDDKQQKAWKLQSSTSKYLMRRTDRKISKSSQFKSPFAWPRHDFLIPCCWDLEILKLLLRKYLQRNTGRWTAKQNLPTYLNFRCKGSSKNKALQTFFNGKMTDTKIGFLIQIFLFWVLSFWSQNSISFLLYWFVMRLRLSTAEVHSSFKHMLVCIKRNYTSIIEKQCSNCQQFKKATLPTYDYIIELEWVVVDATKITFF